MVLKRLVRSALSVNDKGLASRLDRSWNRATPKINELIIRTHKNLDQLPENYVVCASQTICSKVDNTVPLNDYIKAVTLLAQNVLRAMNRATRLVYPDINQARKATNKTGKAIKAERKRLIAKAKSIPPVQSICG